MTIVVTGGAGQLGRAVIAALAERGRRALPASRRTGVDPQTGARLASVLDEADGVVHCGSHPLQARAVDLDGTRRMIRWRWCRRASVPSLSTSTWWRKRLADLVLGPVPTGFV